MRQATILEVVLAVQWKEIPVDGAGYIPIILIFSFIRHQIWNSLLVVVQMRHT